VSLKHNAVVSRRWWGIGLLAGLLVTLAAWAITSPVGSSPDDDYHLTSIWCAGGERTGVCETDPQFTTDVFVPESVGFAHACFAYDSTTNAGCTLTLTDQLRATDRANSIQGLYPTSFYRAMGVFVGDDVQRSVVAMRIFNAALLVVIVALALWVVQPAIRSAVSVVLASIFIPIGLFIIPSTNPSSWAVMGIIAVWAFGLALLHRQQWNQVRTWLTAAGFALGVFLAVGSRADGGAYVAMTVAVVLVWTGWRRLRRNLISAGVVLAGAAIGGIQFLTFGVPGGGEEAPLGTTEPGPGLFLTNLVYLPVYLAGAVGSNALGWNDTNLPPLVFVFGLLVVGALAYRGVIALQGRRAFAAALALFFLVAVPMVFMQREGLGVGEVVQSRYLLPLMIVVIATLSVTRPLRQGLPLPVPAVIVVTVAMSASAGVALWTHAHRYAAGTEWGLFHLNLEMEWTGVTALPLPLVVAVGCLSAAVYIASAFMLAYRDGITARKGSPTAAYRPAR